VIVLAAALNALSGCSSATAFCDATGRGSNPHAAITSYLHKCGADYSIAAGPYDADKASSAYAN